MGSDTAGCLMYGIVVTPDDFVGDAYGRLSTAFGIDYDCDADDLDSRDLVEIMELLGKKLRRYRMDCETFSSYVDPAWVVGKRVAYVDGDGTGYAATSEVKISAAVRFAKKRRDVFRRLRAAMPTVGKAQLVVTVMRTDS